MLPKKLWISQDAFLPAAIPFCNSADSSAKIGSVDSRPPLMQGQLISHQGQIPLSIIDQEVEVSMHPVAGRPDLEDAVGKDAPMTAAEEPTVAVAGGHRGRD
ncbi:hypothetical protein SKAU_G00353720 [Synaphobranchus kaupii]|uniref:Uncharacterized protein n=1 Tax=Synaphobranchus kaupii TaxID=118154 RepID=A0A9Q1IIG5_SYNKA|nr:hypothetical protein SKAU_G00353720 [Synaphobranchus kaupii]